MCWQGLYSADCSCCCSSCCSSCCVLIVVVMCWQGLYSAARCLLQRKFIAHDVWARVSIWAQSLLMLPFCIHVSSFTLSVNVSVSVYYKYIRDAQTIGRHLVDLHILVTGHLPFFSRPYWVVRSLYGTMFCPFVVCLSSVMFCIVAKWYVLEGRWWYRWIGRW